MSAALGMSKTKSKTSSQQDPWEPAIPALNDYLGKIGDLSTEPMTGAQSTAAKDIEATYAQGNPYAGQLSNLANDFLTGPQSQSGMVGDAYKTMQDQLTPYANGSFLDFKENPYMNDMLTQVGDSVQQRINAQFAGAGRDMSGMNQKSVASGVTAAQLPLLLDQFNKQQANQLSASQALQGAGANTGQIMQGLDTNALTTRGAGVPIADAANNAALWGDQGIYNTEQTIADSPFQRLGMLGNLLLPVAQLGQQQSGTGSSNTVGLNVGAKLLSDERLKENIEEIGTMADGTPMVRFNYKGENTVRIGVKAQDVEELTPEAVSEYNAPQAGTDDGKVKYVDMDLATRRSADMLKNGMGPIDGVAANAPGLGMLSGMGAGPSPEMAGGPGPSMMPPPGGPPMLPPAGPGGPAYPPPQQRPMLEDELFMQQQRKAA